MSANADKGGAGESDGVGGNAGGDAVPSMNPPVCNVTFSCFGRVRNEESGAHGRVGRAEGWGEHTEGKKRYSPIEPPATHGRTGLPSRRTPLPNMYNNE